MNLQKFWLITTMAASLLIPGQGLAYERTSTGYVSSVTSRLLVMDGVTYRFRPNREEKEPVKVQCAVMDKRIDCEELAPINMRNRAKATITFDSAGHVVRVQLLDTLK